MNSVKIFNYVVNRYPKDIKTHAVRVADMCIKYGFDYMTVGLLHDIIEDTDTTLDELPEDIRIDIATLTRRSDETYFEYINRIKNNGSKRAITVKLCDINNHLNQKDTLKDSLKKRYLKAQGILNERTDINI
ncbi:MAG: hypothetical protein J6S67_18085 [Methanobrevibacter sp.]|nr:hypothetical protein [Methanobrevibacter sp.]